jgi:hypothetical protein
VSDILAFIQARLTDEEADALAATQEPWSLPWPGKPFINIGDLGGAVVGQGPWNTGKLAADAGDVAHMVRQNPAATLARVAALRALVAPHKPYEHRVSILDPNSRLIAVECNRCIAPKEEQEDWPCDVVKGVAAIWRVQSDGSPHPDYDGSWRP